MKNKKIALALIFISMFSGITFSQFLTGFGVKGGVTMGGQNFEFANYPTHYDPKPILGYNASFFVEVINNKVITAVVDHSYEQRGHSVEVIKTDEFGNQTGTFDMIFRTHYLSVGTLAKIRYETESVTPYLVIGPRIDMYLGYKISYSEGEPAIGDPGALKSVIHEDTKKFNYSINLGAGLQFEKLFPFQTMVEFNYSPAINSSYNNTFVIVKDHYMNLKLGINFIKKKSKSNKK